MATIRKVRISPKAATEMLEKANGNRPVSRTAVKKLVNDMINGSWIANTGDTVKLNSDGLLIDGQHRLHAIVESGVTQMMLVATNCDDRSFEVLDSGRKRSLADVLSIQGYTYSSMTSTAIRALASIHQSINKATRNTWTNSEYLELLAEHPHLHKFVKIVANRDKSEYRMACGFGTGFLAAMMYHGSQLETSSEEEIVDFVNGLLSGSNLDAGDPRLKMRNFLIESKRTKQNVHRTTMYRLLVKCWNCYRSDKRFDTGLKPIHTLEMK